MLKRKPFRSPKYLAFVRSLPCAICGTEQGVIAHHLIGMWGMSGMGMKAPDSMTIPLCDGPGNTCHRLVHSKTGMREQQPKWMRATLRSGLEVFDGDIAEQLLHALALIEAKEAA